MTPLPAPLRWLHSLEWRRGFFDWARSDGVTWVYIFKVLLAAFLTLWLAMRLELPQPRTIELAADAAAVAEACLPHYRRLHALRMRLD